MGFFGVFMIVPHFGVLVSGQGTAVKNVMFVTRALQCSLHCMSVKFPLFWSSRCQGTAVKLIMCSRTFLVVAIRVWVIC